MKLHSIAFGFSSAVRARQRTCWSVALAALQSPVGRSPRDINSLSSLRYIDPIADGHCRPQQPSVPGFSIRALRHHDWDRPD